MAAHVEARQHKNNILKVLLATIVFSIPHLMADYFDTIFKN